MSIFKVNLGIFFDIYLKKYKIRIDIYGNMSYHLLIGSEQKSLVKTNVS